MNKLRPFKYRRKFYVDPSPEGTKTNWQLNIEVNRLDPSIGKDSYKINYDTAEQSENYYSYDNIQDISEYEIEDGDYIEYDVRWSNNENFIGFNYICTDDTNLKDSGALDQNGLSMSPQIDISEFCEDTWYSRKALIPKSHVGKTIEKYQIELDCSFKTYKAGVSGSNLWTDVCAAPDGSIYACSNGNGIYYKSNGSDEFLLISGTEDKNWTCLTVLSDGDVYAGIYDGDLYVRYSAGQFYAKGETSRKWTGLGRDSNDNIYASVENGKLLRQESGVFVEILDSIIAPWTDIHITQANHLYACTSTGAMFYSDSISEINFTAVEPSTVNWTGITSSSSGDVLATGLNDDIYKRTNGSGPFVGTGQVVRAWEGITYDSVNQSYYAIVSGGDIYKKARRLPSWDTFFTTRHDTIIGMCFDNADLLWVLTTEGVYTQTTIGGILTKKTSFNSNQTGIGFANGKIYVTTTNSNKSEVLELQYHEGTEFSSAGWWFSSVASSNSHNFRGISYNRYVVTNSEQVLSWYTIFGYIVWNNEWTINGAELRGIGGNYTITSSKIYNRTTQCSVPVGATNFTGIIKKSNTSDVYVVGNGRVYYANNGSNSFVEITDISKTGMKGYCVSDSGIEYCYDNSKVYVLGPGEETYFESVGSNETATSLNWTDICSDLNGNIYACAYDDYIYKQSGGSGKFVITNSTKQNWMFVAVDKKFGNVYGCIDDGNIYKQPQGGSSFTSIGKPTTTNPTWIWMKANPKTGELFISNGTFIWKYTGSSWINILVSQTFAHQVGGAFDINGNLYIAITGSTVIDDGIYKSTYVEGQAQLNFEKIISLDRLTGIYSDFSGNLYALASLPGNALNRMVYKQTTNMPGFTILCQTTKPWASLTISPTGYIYGLLPYCEIFKFKNWNTTKYSSGYIKNIRITDGTSTKHVILAGTEPSMSTTNSSRSMEFNGLNEFERQDVENGVFVGIQEMPNKDIYAITNIGRVYKQVKGSGEFTYVCKLHAYQDIPTNDLVVSPLTGNLYALTGSVAGGSRIYVRYSGSIDTFYELHANVQWPIDWRRYWTGMGISASTGKVYLTTCHINNASHDNEGIWYCDSEVALIEGTLIQIPGTTMQYWRSIVVDFDNNVIAIEANGAAGKVWMKYESDSRFFTLTFPGQYDAYYLQKLCVAPDGDVYLLKSGHAYYGGNVLYVKYRGDSSNSFNKVTIPSTTMSSAITHNSLCITKNWSIYFGTTSQFIWKSSFIGTSCSLIYFGSYPPTEDGISANIAGRKVKEDFSDLRFTKLDGITILPHWVEKIEEDVAYVWVKLDSIPFDPILDNLSQLVGLSYQNFIETNGFGLGIDNTEVIDIESIHYESSEPPKLESVKDDSDIFNCETCEKQSTCEIYNRKEKYLVSIQEPQPKLTQEDRCNNCQEKNTCMLKEIILNSESTEEELKTYNTKYGAEGTIGVYFYPEGGVDANGIPMGRQGLCIEGTYITAAQLSSIIIPRPPSKWKTYLNASNPYWLKFMNGITSEGSAPLCSCAQRQITTSYYFNIAEGNPQYVGICWVDKPTYVISFDGNGGSGAASQTILAEDPVLAYVPGSSKKGYYFIGWFRGDTLVTTSTRFSGSETVMAHWQSYSYTLTYDSQGGTPVDPFTVTIASPKETIREVTGENMPIPTREGAEFGGWWTTVQGAPPGIRIYADDKITATRTLYAKWLGTPVESAFYMYYGCAKPPEASASSITRTMDSGLWYWYYEGENFNQIKGNARCNKTINLSWDASTPTRVTSAAFETTAVNVATSLRFQGWIINRGEGYHVIYTRSREGVNLYVPQENLIISEFHDTGTEIEYFTPSFNLVTPISISLEYYRKANTAGRINLAWQPAEGGNANPIPLEYLKCNKQAASPPKFSRWGLEESMVIKYNFIF